MDRPARGGKSCAKKASKSTPVSAALVPDSEDSDTDPSFDPSSAEVPISTLTDEEAKKTAIKAMMGSLVGGAGGAAGNSELINALQEKLDGMVGLRSGFLESLPGKIKRRIEKLQEVQEKHDELEEKFREERRALEEKYAKLYAPLYQRARTSSRDERTSSSQHQQRMTTTKETTTATTKLEGGRRVLAFRTSGSWR